MTATFVIKCLGIVDGRPGPSGQYLKEYDNRTGESVWTVALESAKGYETLEDAIAEYRSVHETDPVRPWDGQPNRPLTAFNVEFTPIQEEKERMWGM